MRAEELRIGNFVGCKLSNDHGVYQVAGIDGWTRIFKSKKDIEKYKKETIDTKGKPVEWNDERLIRLYGGVRDNELYAKSKIKPIHLTEEWLLKFGFEKDNAGSFSSKMIDNYSIRIWYVSGAFRWTANYFCSAELKYVHQLQNLYFALTGQELEYKS